MKDTVSALGVLYQGERSDASSIFNVAMAMMGIAAAYVIGAISLADKYGTASIPWFVVALLPIPLWIISSFHSLITLNAMNHGLSVHILEQEIFEKTGIDERAREHVGSRAGDNVMDIMKSNWAHRVATAFCYAGVALLIVGYTTFVVVQWWSHGPVVMRVIVIAFYTLSVGVVAASWISGLVQLHKATKRWGPPRKEEKKETVPKQRSLLAE